MQPDHRPFCSPVTAYGKSGGPAVWLDFDTGLALVFHPMGEGVL